MRLRLAALLALLMGALLFIGISPSTASQSQDELQISVTLADKSKTTAEFPQGTPIEGVELAVENEAGDEVGTGTTDASGQASIPLEESGVYTVRLDPDTLPEGTELASEDDVTLEGVRILGFSKTVQFPIGLAESTGTPLANRVLDLTVSGLKFGLILALASLGLSLVYGTTGLTNFAHSELITLGAMLAFVFNTTIGMHILWAAALASFAMFVIGYLQDVGFWRPLRKLGTGNIALMIVSIGLAILLRNLYQYTFGAETSQYAQYATQRAWSIGPVSITPKELAIAGIALLLLIIVSLALAKTRLGKATRAVADNPSLAAATGINVNSVISLVWILGTGLAGIAGIMLGLDQGVEYQMGLKHLLLVFAAVTLGGLGTIWGAMIGGLIVGVFIDLSTLVVPGDVKYVGALLILIGILILRPQGIFGRKERIG